MARLPQVRRFVAVALAVAYPLLAHAASIASSRGLTLASVTVLAAAILGPPLFDRRRWALLALPVAALAIMALARVDAVALLLFAPPVLLNAYLAWLFGHTLARGDVALIERLVRLLQPPGVPFEPGVLTYARILTGLWTGLFVLLGATNLALAGLASPRGLLEAAGISPSVTVPLETWSLFANVLNYLIVTAVFLLEFTYRRRRFPGRPYRNLVEFFRKAVAVAPALAMTFGKRTARNTAETFAESEFTVPTEHPVFAGHFPGRPLVPAVMLLDIVLESAAGVFGGPLSVAGLPRAKFMAPLAPGEHARIRMTLRADQLEFEVSRGGARVAQGVLRLRLPGVSSDQ